MTREASVIDVAAGDVIMISQNPEPFGASLPPDGSAVTPALTWAIQIRKTGVGGGLTRPGNAMVLSHPSCMLVIARVKMQAE
jgi:hypothetical protein